MLILEKLFEMTIASIRTVISQLFIHLNATHLRPQQKIFKHEEKCTKKLQTRFISLFLAYILNTYSDL